MEQLKQFIQNKLMDKVEPRKLWALNIKYCPDKQMINNEALVRYSYVPVGTESPFSVEAIKDIAHYNFKTFNQAYSSERRDVMGYDAQEKRISAIWSFYKNVKKGDILLYVTSNEIIGYYVAEQDEAEQIEDGEDCIHIRKVEVHKFPYPLFVKDRFGSPFFQLVKREFYLQILDAIGRKV